MGFDPKKIDDFPTQPGVYIMKDLAGQVIYVGKAKSLKQRVKQYFAPGGDGRPQIPYLVAKVCSIETIVVFSEKEALLLENNLIKEHKPRYNALLKDDKSYIALKLTKHKWPMLQLVRYHGKAKPDGQYFGPYTSAYSARETLELLRKLFPLRQCSNEEFARRTRPCILYDMKRCVAPCVGKCTQEEYDQLVKSSVQFLKGQNQEVLKSLYERMRKASDQLEFEEAHSLLSTIRHIEKTVEGQTVDKPLGGDIDALGLFRQGDEVIVARLIMRDGKLMGAKTFDYSHVIEEDAELLESFVMQQYEGKTDLPHEILMPLSLSENEALSEILSVNHRHKVSVLYPQRGDKRSLVEMAQQNAKAAFHQEKDQAEIREKILQEMQEKFNLTRFPETIECIDNSNLSGSEQVSSIVSFKDGVKNKAGYRRYRIRAAAASDDYAAMQEVLTRHYTKAKESEGLPDLLIVDGGKGHLNIALKVMRELEIVTVDVISLAKEEGRHDQGLTSERVFLPNVKDPIMFRQNSPILFLLQQIRDEAHRFVISFQRNRRSKQTLKSELDELPGIALGRRKMLLKHFGSIKKILEATQEEINAVSRLPKAIKEALWQYVLDKKK